ncbi:MAG: hypothetical protein IMF12_05800, partial [Proteobacteria bacterium]|nr:hypothetical protein [Pseudomonadota bacterium]
MFESIPLNYKVILVGTIFILAILLRKLFAQVILKQLKNFVKQTQTRVDDKIFEALEAPLKLIFTILAFYLMIAVLSLTQNINSFFV